MGRGRKVIDRLVDVTPWLKLPVGAKQVVKDGLAAGMDATGLTWLLHRAQVTLFSPFIRVINYHDVAPSMAASFDRQLRFYKQRFVPVGYDEFAAFRAGRWRHAKPGLMLTFDDGLKSQAQVAAPLLEKHGFRGWFFIPPGFVDVPREQQEAYGSANRIHWSRAPGENLGAMSWDDVRRLDRRHVIGCHTHTHIRLSPALTAEQLDLEICASKRRLERELSHEVDVFCWVGGEEHSYSREAARLIRAAGYRIGFMNAKGVIRPGSDPLQLHRINVEAPYELWYVRYVLSGFLDLVYAPQRRRVNWLTRAENGELGASGTDYGGAPKSVWNSATSSRSTS